jgi:NUMOD4 motif
MTATDGIDLDALEGTWKPVPGFSAYEASHRGYVRSIDRTDALGRRRAGVMLTPRMSNRGYLLIDVVPDEGPRKTVTLHSIILLAFAGPRPEGMEACHASDDPTDNRWPEELSWGPREQNIADRMRNRPATPKPVKVCVRCDREFHGSGRRCHACVVEIGQRAADYLAEGSDLGKVAEVFDYPSEVGIWRLAVKYGGVTVVLRTELEAVNRRLRDLEAAQARHRRSWRWWK